MNNWVWILYIYFFKVSRDHMLKSYHDKRSQQNVSFRLKCWILWTEEDHLTHSSILNSAMMLVNASYDDRLNEVISFKTYHMSFMYTLLKNMVLWNGGTRKSTDGSWELIASFSEMFECSWILFVLCNLYVIFML